MSKSTASKPAAPSIGVWLVDGRNLQVEQLGRMQACLSVQEVHRFNLFQRPERQRQYLLGRMLLRQAISHATGVPSSAISTIERPGSGPLLILPEGIRHPAFSLSHSRHWIACAVGFGDALGLDIEAIDPERDVIALSEAGFRADEHAWLLSRIDTERVAAFYRLWTLKEALFKLLSNRGEQREAPPVVDRENELLSHGDDWFSSSMEHPTLSITICSTQSLPDISLIELSEFV